MMGCAIASLLLRFVLVFGVVLSFSLDLSFFFAAQSFGGVSSARPCSSSDSPHSHVSSYHLTLPSTFSGSSYYFYDNMERALTTVLSTQLVSQSLRIISTAIRSGYCKDLFSSRDHRGASAGRRRAEHQTKKCVFVPIARLPL
ncbi:hypothetical protein FIBSPDRAFT_602909 [Athelia psychrophila]|uniref:Uncharacterized protein n=1 Tax=Athelia psychrophila TaxID=1759441 RepID=A0A166GQ77_9AGAM|nr:hypothetical protein FIBSPDRAFT_602909 [Fibularhizoctonia sp. CBS 109695]